MRQLPIRFGAIVFACALQATFVFPAYSQDEIDEDIVQVGGECGNPPRELSYAKLSAIEDSAVTEDSEFDCEEDWLQTEMILQPLLPIIGEPSFLSLSEEAGDNPSIAMRRFLIAYGAVAEVQSVVCQTKEDEDSPWRDEGVGGIATKVRLWGAGAEQERGIWRQELTASECDFLSQTLDEYDPDDIVHLTKPGSPITKDGEIILVHGRVFYEFVDGYGYSVKLRHGLNEPADRESEENQRVLALFLDFFSQRALEEGQKTELPEEVD